MTTAITIPIAENQTKFGQPPKPRGPERQEGNGCGQATQENGRAEPPGHTWPNRIIVNSAFAHPSENHVHREIDTQSDEQHRECQRKYIERPDGEGCKCSGKHKPDQKRAHSRDDRPE